MVKCGCAADEIISIARDTQGRASFARPGPRYSGNSTCMMAGIADRRHETGPANWEHLTSRALAKVAG
jgi:hypothetical protein